MRKPIIAGNWKMHKTLPEAKNFMGEISGVVPAKDSREGALVYQTRRSPFNSPRPRGGRKKIAKQKHALLVRWARPFPADRQRPSRYPQSNHRKPKSTSAGRSTACALFRRRAAENTNPASNPNRPATAVSLPQPPLRANPEQPASPSAPRR